MKDFWESIINNVKNRTGTPFLSATLFAFIVIHIELFYVALFLGNKTITIGNINYSNSLDYIKTLEYDDYENYWCPLLIGLGYALFIPFITNLSKWWDRKVLSMLYNRLKALFEKYPKPEDYKILTEENVNMNKKIEDYKIKLKSLNEDNSKKEIEIKKYKDNNRETSNELAKVLEDTRFLKDIFLKESILFKSINYEEEYVRVTDSNNKALILGKFDNDLEKINSGFRIVRGLYNSKNDISVSFQSLVYPDSYLRHRKFRFYIESRTYNNDYEQFNKDATFEITSGLADTNMKSIKPINVKDFSNIDDYYLFNYNKEIKLVSRSKEIIKNYDKYAKFEFFNLNL